MCDCGTWLFNGKCLEKSPTKKSSQTLLIATIVAHSMELDLKRERDKAKLAGDIPGGSTPMAEGQFAIEVLQAISVQAEDGSKHASVIRWPSEDQCHHGLYQQ